MGRQDMGNLTAWATDSRQILWRRDGGNRRRTAPRVRARSLPENMAFRSDILSEARQNGAGDHEHTARAMSRQVMWHELRAMREENRATLSGGPRRFIRQTTGLLGNADGVAHRHQVCYKQVYGCIRYSSEDLLDIPQRYITKSVQDSTKFGNLHA